MKRLNNWANMGGEIDLLLREYTVAVMAINTESAVKYKSIARSVARLKLVDDLLELYGFPSGNKFYNPQTAQRLMEVSQGHALPLD